MTLFGMLFVVFFLTGSSWALASLVLRFRRERVDARWWAALFTLVGLGLLAGIWCAFYCEYPLGENYRVGSFPLPVVFFHLEDGKWVDFPVPEFQALSAAFSNIITMTTLATVPLWLLSWRQHRHEHTGAQPASCS